MADRRELEALRTRVANQAASLADTVTEGFDEFHMGAGDYVVELTAPEGMSTGGGAQALLHLRLVPRRKGYAVVVAGQVNPVAASCELRTFDHVAMLHELRFRTPLEITADEYDDFLRKAEVVMNLARIVSHRQGPSPELAARAGREAKAAGKLSIPALVVFIVVVLLAAFVAYRILRVVKGTP